MVHHGAVNLGRFRQSGNEVVYDRRRGGAPCVRELARAHRRHGARGRVAALPQSDEGADSRSRGEAPRRGHRRRNLRHRRAGNRERRRSRNLQGERSDDELRRLVQRDVHRPPHHGVSAHEPRPLFARVPHHPPSRPRATAQSLGVRQDKLRRPHNHKRNHRNRHPQQLSLAMAELRRDFPPRDSYDGVEITHPELQSIFDPVVAQILNLISTQLRECGDEITALVVGGGFAESPCLLDCIRRRFYPRSHTTSARLTLAARSRKAPWRWRYTLSSGCPGFASGRMGLQFASISKQGIRRSTW